MERTYRIKTCPFCGCEPVLIFDDDQGCFIMMIKCIGEDDCPQIKTTSAVKDIDAVEQLIQLWNHRV